jgi:hypothetical protein
MNMIKDRNRTSRTYNQVTADSIAKNITTRYFSLFLSLRETMKNLKKNDW